MIAQCATSREQAVSLPEHRSGPGESELCLSREARGVDENGMPTEPFSFVLKFPAASPEDARRHFLSRLAVETDVSDVTNDLERKRGGFVVVDVRNQKAYTERHIPGAIHRPWRTIDEGFASEVRGKLVVVYCWGPSCNAANKGAARLAGLGVQVKEMIGGFEYWLREGKDTEGTVPRSVPLSLE